MLGEEKSNFVQQKNLYGSPNVNGLKVEFSQHKKMERTKCPRLNFKF